MRRFAAAIVITVIGLYFTLSYKSSPARRVVASASSAAPTTSTLPPADSGTTLPADAGTTPPAAGSPPTSSVPRGGARTINGAAVDTRYGVVQVAITLNGTQITDVNALQLPFDRPRSQYISQQAAPLLRQEALTAQSAQIDTLSGATYTSEGYAQSLQSALDQAHG